MINTLKLPRREQVGARLPIDLVIRMDSVALGHNLNRTETLELLLSLGLKTWGELQRRQHPEEVAS